MTSAGAKFGLNDLTVLAAIARIKTPAILAPALGLAENAFAVTLTSDLIPHVTPDKNIPITASCPRRSIRFLLRTPVNVIPSFCSIEIVLGANTLGKSLWKMPSKIIGIKNVNRPSKNKII